MSSVRNATPAFSAGLPVAVCLLVLLLALGTSGLVSASEVTSISIVDAPRPQPRWGFAPATRKIQPGTWVTWSNDGRDAHTVTAVDNSFDSGNLDPSEGFSWYFDQPGTYQYTCALHAWMVGTIVVGNGVGPAVPAPAPSPDDSASATDEPLP